MATSTEAPPIAADNELRKFVSELSVRNDQGLRTLVAAFGRHGELIQTLATMCDEFAGQLEVAQAQQLQLEARIDVLEKQLLSRFPVKDILTHQRGSDGRIVSTTRHSIA